jgi:hypothetical protein
MRRRPARRRQAGCHAAPHLGVGVVLVRLQQRVAGVAHVVVKQRQRLRQQLRRGLARGRAGGRGVGRGEARCGRAQAAGRGAPARCSAAAGGARPVPDPARRPHLVRAQAQRERQQVVARQRVHLDVLRLGLAEVPRREARAAKQPVQRGQPQPQVAAERPPARARLEHRRRAQHAGNRAGAPGTAGSRRRGRGRAAHERRGRKREQLVGGAALALVQPARQRQGVPKQLCQLQRAPHMGAGLGGAAACCRKRVRAARRAEQLLLQLQRAHAVAQHRQRLAARAAVGRGRGGGLVLRRRRERQEALRQCGREPRGVGWRQRRHVRPQVHRAAEQVAEPGVKGCRRWV